MISFLRELRRHNPTRPSAIDAALAYLARLTWAQTAPPQPPIEEPPVDPDDTKPLPTGGAI